MDIILMRHGRTKGNIEKRYNGKTDEPLCEEGIAHAHQTGADATVTHVIVSPMKRARQTAKIKFPSAEFSIIDDLREMNFGDFEGRTFSELEHDEDYQRWIDSGCTLSCPNGETMADFSDRICRAFESIVRRATAAGTRRLIIVAHGGTLMAILGKYGTPSRVYYEWHVGNCSGYQVRLNDESWDKAPELTSCTLFETMDDCI